MLPSLLKHLVLGAVIVVTITCSVSTTATFQTPVQRFPARRSVWPSWDSEKPAHAGHVRNGQIGSGHHRVTSRGRTYDFVNDENTKRRDAIINDGNDYNLNFDQERHPHRHVGERSHGPHARATSRIEELDRDGSMNVPQFKTERLTAVASADYSGARAVAFAGYHHHQQRESFDQGYHRVVTPAPNYTKHHAGRRVCTRQAPTTVSHHHGGRQIRLVYTELSTGFFCCPGWTQVTRLSFGCTKPSCSGPCLNGGVCGSPGICTCPKGYTGNQCQTDVNECLTEKPCAQLCQNVPGSYKCLCRTGFHLLADGQSCRKNDSDGTAFEARDLENDYRSTTTRRPMVHDTENEVGERDLDKDYEIILKRLTKLEKQIARGKRRDVGATEMSAKINLAVENISEMKRAVENVQLMQQEIYSMKHKLKLFEQESQRIQVIAGRMGELENRLRIHCAAVKGDGRTVC